MFGKGKESAPTTDESQVRTESVDTFIRSFKALHDVNPGNRWEKQQPDANVPGDIQHWVLMLGDVTASTYVFSSVKSDGTPANYAVNSSTGSHNGGIGTSFPEAIQMAEDAAMLIVPNE